MYDIYEYMYVHTNVCTFYSIENIWNLFTSQLFGNAGTHCYLAASSNVAIKI